MAKTSITLTNDDRTCKNYGPPFDDSDADIVLRSSDHVDFGVDKVILGKSSSFFLDMFSMPRPAEPKTPDSKHGEITPRLPVITVSDPSGIQAMLRSMCYPLADKPAFTSLDDLCVVLAAAKKYDMDHAYKLGSRAFAQSSFLADRPAGLRRRLPLRARARGARTDKAISLENLGEDMAFIDGPALRMLWRYHR